MVLSPCPNATVAPWLVAAGTPVEQLIRFGPTGFDAYARLRFLPDPDVEGLEAGDVPEDEDSPDDFQLTGRVLHVLASHTATPSRVVVAVWDGYDTVRLAGQRVREEPASFCIPARSYRWLEGSIDDVCDGDPDAYPWMVDLPAFVWPQERAWVLTCDVDAYWVGIAGSRNAVHELVMRSDLDVVAADPSQPLIEYL